MGMVPLIGRGVGGFYLLHQHPWLVVAVLLIVVAVVLYRQQRR
jgi:hypothetical protein